MSVQLNYSDKLVTAGQFIERGSKNSTLIDKLSRLSQTISSQSLNSSFNELSKITSDNVVTPSEKKSLKEEFDFIKSAYSNISASIRTMGLEDSEEFKKLSNAYDVLTSKIEPILADMNTTTELSESLDTYVSAYTSAANELNIYVSLVNNSILQEVSDISLVVNSNKNTIKPGESVIFEAIIYSHKTNPPQEISDEIKNYYYDAETGTYPALYQWNISGTKNDEQWIADSKGKRSITIPYSEFENTQVSADFSAEMIVGSTSSS